MEWNTLSIIEHVQRECLKRDGIPEKEWLRGTADRWSTTKYQDKTILSAMMLQYDELSEQIVNSFNNSDDSERVKKILDETVFATANIYPLNGICFHDSEERYGVLFQEGLRFWPLVMAVFAHTALFDDDNTKTSKGFLIIKAMGFYSIEGLISLIIKDLTSPFTLYPVGLYNYFEESDETTKLRIHWIIKGLHGFVLSHELAHIAHGHVKADDSLIDSMPPPPSSYMKYALEEANNSLKEMKDSGEFYFHINKYSSHHGYTLKKSKENSKYYQLSDVTPELKDNVKRQQVETHADRIAIQSMWNMLIQNGYDDDIVFCHFIGVACFFWYQEYLERVQAIIVTKNENASPSIFPNTLLAQNIFERQDHPAPLTRFERAVNIISNSSTSENIDAAKLLKDIWEDVSIMFSGAWDQYVPQYLKTRIEQEDINLHSKWFDDIPFPEDVELNVLGLIGARRYFAS